MANAELSEAERKEFQLLQQDLKMEYTKEKRNALESCVYEMRDKVYYQNSVFEELKNWVILNPPKSKDYSHAKSAENLSLTTSP